MSDWALQVKGLRKAYPGFTLKDVTFALPRGQGRLSALQDTPRPPEQLPLHGEDRGGGGWHRSAEERWLEPGEAAPVGGGRGEVDHAVAQRHGQVLRFDRRGRRPGSPHQATGGGSGRGGGLGSGAHGVRGGQPGPEGPQSPAPGAGAREPASQAAQAVPHAAGLGAAGEGPAEGRRGARAGAQCESGLPAPTLSRHG